MDKLVANEQPIEIRENAIVMREPTVEEWLTLWLSSFNTESATCCFTAVQELKKRLEAEMSDKYCKYPLIEYDYEDEMLEKVCSNCPLNRIQ